MKKRKMIIVVLFLMCTGITGFTQTQSNNITDLYRKGIEAYKNKDFKNYLEIFQKLNALRSNHPVILRTLASAYSLNKKKNEAIASLQQLILINADPKITQNDDFNFIQESKEFKAIVKKIEKIQTPVSNSQTAFVIHEKDLHPESIAYDQKEGTFYLGSIHKRKIVSIDKNGNYKPFTKESQDGLWAVSGIKIDSKNRRLWACSMAIPQMKGFKKEVEGYSGVFLYNLNKGQLIKKYTIKNKPHHHAFGDLAIHPNGDVYITDSRYPAVYRINSHRNNLELFMSMDGFRSLQGLDFSKDRNILFIADYVTGIHIIDINQKRILKKIEPLKNVSLKGIDGLYFYKNSLITIQNGIHPMRIQRFFLSKDLQRITDHNIIERANPDFNEPTLGVLANNDFYYIANSQWNHYHKDGSIFPLEKLQIIKILKTTLQLCIEKTKVQYRKVEIPQQKMDKISLIIEDRLLGVSELTDQLIDARLLLVGEAHLKREVISYFLKVLDGLPDEHLVLCLELPESVQNTIDSYLGTGDEALLESLKKIRGCLPYQEILRWCFNNHKRIQKVLAMDENLDKIRFNRRRLCTDTRNQTMAERIYKAYSDYPQAKIIAYGGQLHMLKSGRYKFDIKNRTSAGSRLFALDVPNEKIKVVMISGEDGFPLAPAWNGNIGAIKADGELASLPFYYFYTYPVYSVSYAKDMFDFFVNVGKTTKIVIKNK